MNSLASKFSIYEVPIKERAYYYDVIYEWGEIARKKCESIDLFDPAYDLFDDCKSVCIELRDSF